MRYFIIVLLIVIPQIIISQSQYVLPGTISDELGDRWDILYDFDHQVFASQRNISRQELTMRALQYYNNPKNSKLDNWDIHYILNDNTEYAMRGMEENTSFLSRDRKKIFDSTGVFYYLEDEVNDAQSDQPISPNKPVFGYFYKTDANFFEINEENFTLRANPILNLKFGNAANDPNIIFQNTRGAEIRGEIDNKIYFYTSILENQARFNNYLEDRIGRFKTIGGQSLFKEFKSGLIENLQGHDYLNAQAYVGINATKSVAIEFGHGRHFIGNGIRSLLMSDYSTNYFYLKFNTRIWKFHYQNLFAELAPIATNLNPGDRVLPKKYMANHYLSFRPTKNIEIGIFEAVVFARENHFEFQYLNPVILYRTVEQFLDSPDNALIGLNGKWNIKNRFQVYGQLILDEFKLSEINSGTGWWANKYGMQAGLKYINVAGIDHLDAQLEYNRVRPFTYGHRDSLSLFPTLSTASYSHHSQPLAHPLGANFTEIVFNLRYRPKENLFINARIISATYGQDSPDTYSGQNILLISGLREGDFGHSIGQGIETNLMSFGLDVSYQFHHNYFLDLHMLVRNADAAIDDLDIETKYVGGGLRVNIGNVISDY